MDLREIGWAGFNWLRTRTSGEVFQHGNETSGFIKCWEILE
jgi:hypothetical protein